MSFQSRVGMLWPGIELTADGNFHTTWSVYTSLTPDSINENLTCPCALCVSKKIKKSTLRTPSAVLKCLLLPKFSADLVIQVFLLLPVLQES